MHKGCNTLEAHPLAVRLATPASNVSRFSSSIDALTNYYAWKHIIDELVDKFWNERQKYEFIC